MLCRFDGCLNAAKERDGRLVEGGFCTAHAQQRTAQQPLKPTRPYGRSKWQAVEDAIHAYFEAPAEDEAAFNRAKWNLKKAIQAYGRGKSGARRRRLRAWPSSDSPGRRQRP